MQVLSNGYKIPVDGERGPVVFPAMEFNITRLNGHTHNGTDSEALTAASVTGVTLSVLSASWVANGPTGQYRQLVTLPAGFDFDKVHLSVRTDGATGEYVAAQIERVSATQFYIYTIDNTQDFSICVGG